jgi:magnesium-transporting ATPase (P-type)
VTLGLALAFEPAEPDSMRRPPRAAKAPLVSGFVLWRVGLVSALIVIGTFGMFAWAMRRGLSLEEARTIAVNTIVVLEIAYLFSVRFLHLTSVSVQGILGTPAVLITVGLVIMLQLVLTYAPFMHVLFATRPVAFLDGLAIIGVGAALLAILEIEKLVRRGLGRGGPVTAP